MGSLIIPTSVMMSIVLGGVIGYFIGKRMTLSKEKLQNVQLYDQLKSTQQELENKKAENIELDLKITDLKLQIDKLREENVQIRHQAKISEAENIKEKQIELIAEYNKGKLDAQKEYKILITPFLYYNDQFFRKKARSGYRYHLLIKGAPAFEPKDVVVSEETKWDEDVKKAMISAVNTAIQIAQKQLCAIDSEVSQFEIKKITK